MEDRIREYWNEVGTKPTHLVMNMDMYNRLGAETRIAQNIRLARGDTLTVLFHDIECLVVADIGDEVICGWK